jgi:hypothetical protein
VSREVERHGDAAAVLPYDRERCCALVVHLFRAPVFQEAGTEAIEEACSRLSVCDAPGPPNVTCVGT